VEGAATIGDAQRPFEGTNLLLPSPASAVFRSHGFVESFVYVREIRPSSDVGSQGLLPKVEGNTEQAPSVSDGQGATLQVCKPKHYHGPLSRSEKHLVGGKREFVATLALGSRPRQGVARLRESRGKKPGSQKEGSPGAKAKALEGCEPRGSPGVITYSRESKEVRGSVRE
jgi:hypothetical protein